MHDAMIASVSPRCSVCCSVIPMEDTFDSYGGRILCKKCKRSSRAPTVILDHGTVQYYLQKIRGLSQAAKGIRAALSSQGIQGNEDEFALLYQEIVDVINYINDIYIDLKDSDEDEA